MEMTFRVELRIDAVNTAQGLGLSGLAELPDALHRAVAQTLAGPDLALRGVVVEGVTVKAYTTQE